MTIAYISHTSCHLHDQGSPYHPELPARLQAINDQLIASGLMQVLVQYEPDPASIKDLHRVHDAAYLQHVTDIAPSKAGQRVDLDGDTSMNEYSLTASLHAAGAAIQAVDLVLGDGLHKKAFCAVRPPGHHAGKAHAAGFCIFNNIALAAVYAIEQHGLKRVAIVDFDVHHGDGTEAIVSDRAEILFCSSFQHPFYPYSGDGVTAKNVINLPLSPGTSGKQWRQVMRAECLSALHQFEPELILISAGFDSHQEDDMGGLNLREEDYAWITKELSQIAAQYGQGRVISSLEGGYDLSSLGRSVVAHLKAMS